MAVERAIQIHDDSEKRTELIRKTNYLRRLVSSSRQLLNRYQGFINEQFHIANPVITTNILRASQIISALELLVEQLTALLSNGSAVALNTACQLVEREIVFRDQQDSVHSLIFSERVATLPKITPPECREALGKLFARIEKELSEHNGSRPLKVA